MITPNDRIAIIIPTYGRRASLLGCLEAVLAQKGATQYNISVIVVDDGSCNMSAALGADFYIWQQDIEYRLATARNVGARLAVANAADILIFLDGDLIPQEGWVNNLVNEVNDTCVIFGAVNKFAFTPKKERPWLIATGGNMCITTKLWKEVGEFNTIYNGRWGVEDTDWTYRACQLGCAVKTVPQADCVHHAHAPKKNWLVDQETNWGLFAGQFGSVGVRPVPQRTDTVFSDERDVLPKMEGLCIVTATKDRPEEARRWRRERLSYGVPIFVADDCEEGTEIDGAVVTMTHAIGTSAATKQAIALAIEAGAKYIVELDDHDSLENGMLDLWRIYKDLEDGADYVYGNYILRTLRRGANFVITEEHYPKMLSERGMSWMGVKAYTVSAYLEVGGYIGEDFPAGDYSLALRMELAGKKFKRCKDLWTNCPMPDGALTVAHKQEAHAKVLEYRAKYITASPAPQ